jgi:hypothetical protein
MPARIANSTANKGVIATPHHEPNSNGVPRKNSTVPLYIGCRTKA